MDYKNAFKNLITDDRFAYAMIILCLSIGLTAGYLYVQETDAEIISNQEESDIQMNILETEKGVKVDVLRAGENIDSLLIEYNDKDKKVYNLTENVKYNKGDGEYHIYYITDSDELKLYETYTRIKLEDDEEYI